MASVKKNFCYNLILTFCNYLFPLITYPYVSRVLGVERIGACNFVDGIVNYFVLLSTLGIGSYGVREIAKCKNDPQKRNFVFSNLIVINIITTIIAVISLVCATLWIQSLQSYRDFLWLGIIKLVFNMFLIEWFFQGIQEFKYITIRSVIVRLVYVICVFVFVHTKSDVIIYYGLIVFTSLINAVINWGYSSKYRKLSFRHLQLGLFIAPILSFGYYRLLTSMYTSFNLIFLGFTTNDAEVGYFSTATKMYSILMGVFTAFTTVMVPKVSEMLAYGEKKKLQIMANKTFSLLTIISLPIIVFSLFCAEDIILLLSGPGYEGANTPFRIVIFLLLIIGMEQITIQQFLMASSSSKSIATVSTVGAVVGFFLNLLITPRLGAVGSSISWGISELAVLVTGLYLLKKKLGIILNVSIFFKRIRWSAFYVIPLIVISFFHFVHWVNLIISGMAIIGVFLLINLKVEKDNQIANTIRRIGSFSSLLCILKRAKHT